jgi:hypothetical protein
VRSAWRDRCRRVRSRSYNPNEQEAVWSSRSTTRTG